MRCSCLNGKHGGAVTLEDANGVYYVESKEECVHIDDCLNKLIIPALQASGYNMDVIWRAFHELGEG